MNQFQRGGGGGGALNWIDWTLIMLESMMQPPESKLSWAEVWVFILMPVSLANCGSETRSTTTFCSVVPGARGPQGWRMNQGSWKRPWHLFYLLNRAFSVIVGGCKSLVPHKHSRTNNTRTQRVGQQLFQSERGPGLDGSESRGGVALLVCSLRLVS